MTNWNEYAERYTNESQTHSLMRQGQLRAIQQMATKYSDNSDELKKFINEQDESGETLATIAVSSNDIESLEWLYKNGADFNIINYRNVSIGDIIKNDYTEKEKYGVVKFFDDNNIELKLSYYQENDN